MTDKRPFSTCSGAATTQAMLLLSVFALMALGAVIIFSSSAARNAGPNLVNLHLIQKHAVFLVASLLVMLLASRADYHFLLKKWPLILLGAVTLLLLGIVLAFGPVNGARRWIRLGGFSFQPSELAKFTTILLMTRLLIGLNDRIHSYWVGFAIPALAGGAVAALILLERDLGTPVLLMAVVLAMMLAAGVRWWHPLTVAPFALGALAYLIVSAPHRLKRLLVFLDPWQDPQNSGFQIIQSLVAIHSGGMLGTGLGKGMQKHGFLPAHYTDFIFSMVAEELGFAGCALVVALFAVFLLAGLRTLQHAPDFEGSLLSIGVTTTLGLQAAINLGVVTSLLPTKGLALPFISVGGSSMLIAAAAVGLLLNVAGQGAYPEENEVDNFAAVVEGIPFQ